MGMFSGIGKALGGAVGLGGGAAKPMAGTAQGSVAPAGPAAPVGLKLAALKGGMPGGVKPMAQPAGGAGGFGAGIASAATLAAPPGQSKKMLTARGFRGGKR